ncbi:MAG: ATP-binding cassette domain-containing protein, partial [Flavobacteriaceae bacterium]|nr:ATP-binding cassette domain-containing protein [Flavobacteriaceae bacterium]
SLQDTKISMERIADIREKEDEDVDRPVKYMSNNENNIAIKNLSFTYTGTKNEVLKNINLEVKEGKTIAIVGASGSGKTTLIKLLLQYYPILKGNIQIGEIGLNKIDTKYWRSQCGAVMQDGFIFSDTIAKNIAISDDMIDLERLAYAVEVANLNEFIDKCPLKFDTMIGQEGRGLSQGQKQRILIARAVYKNPNFLFLDEATNALDSENEKQITDKLENFMKDKTVFIVAHRLSTVKNADQIIVLNDGCIVEQGTHSELVSKSGFYYKLIKNQLELGS